MAACSVLIMVIRRGWGGACNCQLWEASACKDKEKQTVSTPLVFSLLFPSLLSCSFDLFSPLRPPPSAAPPSAPCPSEGGLFDAAALRVGWAVAVTGLRDWL